MTSRTDAPASPSSTSDVTTANLQQRLAPYKRPDARRSAMQIVNTAIPFAVCWWLMLRSLEISYLLVLVLAVPAAFLLIRLFILQHDCGHGAFFTSRRANDWVGSILGVVTLTPYHYWRRTHQIHHATHGDLDRRGMGDVDTMTVREYLEASWLRRLGYRLYRHPIVMFLIGPTWVFVIKHRFPWDMPKGWRREWASVAFNDLALAGILVLAHFTIGLKALFLVHGPIFLMSGALGVWMFYVQHQFEDTYWRHRPEWDFELAGLAGSSFYDLPRVLHWFTGNIGYHHIHHLAAHIPNYRLPECFEAIPELQRVTRISILESLRCARLKLWDEDAGQLIGWRDLRRLRAAT